jgi:hypothetical protein
MAKKQQNESSEQPGRIKKHGFVKDLVCDLSREEVESRGQDMAAAKERSSELEGQFDKEKKAWKAKIEDCEREVSRLAGEIISRKTVRPVKCQKVLDFEAGEVREARLDTGEIIATRPMSATERQKELDFDGDLEEEFDDPGAEESQ